jgi:hypothetical protein
MPLAKMFQVHIGKYITGGNKMLYNGFKVYKTFTNVKLIPNGFESYSTAGNTQLGKLINQCKKELIDRIIHYKVNYDKSVSIIYKQV